MDTKQPKPIDYLKEYLQSVNSISASYYHTDRGKYISIRHGLGLTHWIKCVDNLIIIGVAGNPEPINIIPLEHPTAFEQTEQIVNK